jgi:hypothetical protein
MNSWQLFGQQNLRNDPARCDENVLLVHNVGTFLCIRMLFSAAAESGSQRWKKMKRENSTQAKRT